MQRVEVGGLFAPDWQVGGLLPCHTPQSGLIAARELWSVAKKQHSVEESQERENLRLHHTFPADFRTKATKDATCGRHDWFPPCVAEADLPYKCSLPQGHGQRRRVLVHLVSGGGAVVALSLHRPTCLQSVSELRATWPDAMTSVLSTHAAGRAWERRGPPNECPAIDMGRPP